MPLRELTLPTHTHQRIVIDIGAAAEIRPRLELERCIRPEDDTADQIVARGDDDCPTSGGDTSVERLLYRGGVFGMAIAFGADIAHIPGVRGCGNRGWSNGRVSRLTQDASDRERHTQDDSATHGRRIVRN